VTSYQKNCRVFSRKTFALKYKKEGDVMYKAKVYIKSFIACLVILLPLFFTACGPTAEEIRAREEQRQQSKESQVHEADEAIRNLDKDISR